VERCEQMTQWKKLHSKKHRVIKRRRMRWEGNVARMEMRTKYKVTVGKPEGKRPLERG